MHWTQVVDILDSRGCSLVVDILASRGCSLVVDILDSRGCSLVVDKQDLGGSLVAKTVDASTCSFEEYVSLKEAPVISNCKLLEDNDCAISRT